MSFIQSKHLRIVAIVMIVVLFVQYEFGIATIMANPASIPPFSFSIATVTNALTQVGIIALIHAGLGSLLFILSILNLILAWRTNDRMARIFGAFGFLSMLFAAGGGLYFVLSGFQNDNASHAMATNFLLAYTWYFLELFYARLSLRRSGSRPVPGGNQDG